MGFTEDQVKVFGKSLGEYLKSYKESLDGYTWDMQESCIKKAKEMGLMTVDDMQGGFKETVKLRQSVADRARKICFENSNNRANELTELASFVIKDWGALGGNKLETISGYAQRFTGPTVSISSIHSYQDLLQAVAPVRSSLVFKMEGIASWSKWISFIWSDWALIYDARIAFTLNAIHFISDLQVPVFIEPPGRNTLLEGFNAQSSAVLNAMALTKKQEKYSYLQMEQVKLIKKQMASFTIQKKSVYLYYLEVMKEAHQWLWEDAASSTPLLHTEMLLFKISTDEVVKDYVTQVLTKFSA